MKPTDISLEQEPREDSETLEVTPGEKEADEASESNFPHFHYESKSPLGIPSTGVMQVEYEVVFQGGDAKNGYISKVDLHRITGVSGFGKDRPLRTEEALDQIAAERMKSSNVSSR